MRLSITLSTVLLSSLVSAVPTTDGNVKRDMRAYVVENSAPVAAMSDSQWSNLRKRDGPEAGADLSERHIGLAGRPSTDGLRQAKVLGPVDDSELRARSPAQPKSASRRLRRNHSLRSAEHHSPRSANHPTRNLKPISLPLRSVRQAVGSSPVHGLVYLQQHINRAHRRHAEMLGKKVDQGLLKRNMEKRLESLGLTVDLKNLRKRDIVGDLLGGLGVGMDGKKVPTSGSDRSAASNATSTKNSTSSNSGSDSNTAGFSQLEFEAAVSGKTTEASAVTASQSIGLAIEANDVGYFAPVTMGTPGKTFQILMDSGSADLWVPSQVCTSCGTHTQLGSKTSSSFVASRQAFQVTYGTGQVQGAIITDDIELAGLKLTNHTFGVTTDESEEFSSQGVPFDGLMGLAQSTLSNQGVETPIEALKTKGLVSAAQVSYKLGRVADGTNDGQITFGGVDSSKFSGNLTLFDNVSKQGFWEGAVGATTVDGKNVGLKGKTAILDTGTTLIIMPEADADAVHKLIPGAAADGQGGYTLPCTTKAVVSMTFGGSTFSIDPRDLAFQPLTNDLQGTCASGISAGNIGGANQWLVGDVFLKSQYFSTIVDSNQMGLAVANVPAGAKTA